MPLRDGRADILRRVVGVSGTVRMRHEWVVRFGYGKVRPWVRRRLDGSGNEVISAVAGPDMVVLRGSRLPRAVDGHHEDEFDVHEGDELDLLHHLVPLAQARSRGRGRGPPDRRDDGAQRALVRPVRLHRPLPGGGDPLPAGAAAAHPRRHRRHRRGPHHVAAGGLRRQPQLGLPLLLAARRLADRRGAAGLRLRPGDAPVAGLAAARHRRRPRGHADHVRRGRRPRAARARADAPARLRRLAAGPARERARSTSARPTCSAR